MAIYPLLIYVFYQSSPGRPLAHDSLQSTGGSVDELCEQNTQEILLNEALHGEEEGDKTAINGVTNGNANGTANTNTSEAAYNNNVVHSRPPQNIPQSTSRQQQAPQPTRPATATTSHALQRAAATQPRQTSIQNHASNPPQPPRKQEPSIQQEAAIRLAPVIIPGVIKQEPSPLSSPQQADFIDDFLTDCLDLMEEDCETSEHSLTDLSSATQVGLLLF